MYNLCRQECVSPLCTTDKRQHGVPAGHSSPSVEKHYSHKGLTFVLTWSPLYNIGWRLDELSGPPANSELMCWKPEPEQRAIISAVPQPDALQTVQGHAQAPCPVVHQPGEAAGFRHTQTGHISTLRHVATEALGPLLRSQVHICLTWTDPKESPGSLLSLSQLYGKTTLKET